MEKSRLITKIEYKGEKLKIEWDEDSHYGHKDKHVMTTKVEPHRDFVSALRAMDKHLCAECELPENDEEYVRHDIIGIKCTYDEDEKTGAVKISASIQSARRMQEAEEPMKIESPMKPESDEMGRALHPSTVDAMEKLIREAQAFLKGKRHDLFSDVEVSEA